MEKEIKSMGKIRKFLFIFLITIFLFFQGKEVFAEPTILNFSVAPSSVWISKEVNFYLECYSNISNETLNAWVQLNSPISKKIDLNKVGYKFSGSYSTFPYLGIYSGNLVCADNITTISQPISFEVKDLLVNLVGIEPQIIYPDSEWKIFLKIKEKGESEKEIKEGVTFTVSTKDKVLFLDYFYDVANSRWVLAPEKISEGEYEIEIKVSYQGIEKKISTLIKVYPILQLSIISINKEVLSKQLLPITLQAKYRGNLTSLKFMSLLTLIDGENVEISSVDDQSLAIILPEKPAGPHELKIIANYKGYEGFVATLLEYVLPIEGVMVDAEGKAVSGRLTFSKVGYSKQIVVNGPYFGYVPKGEYEVRFETGNFKITLTSVSIEESWSNLLKIDTFGKNVKLPGLKVAGGAAIEFAKSFGEAQIEIGYDSRVILNELLIKVYACENWNFQARSCAEKWKEISAEVDTIRDVVKLKVTKLSAFLIGEMSSLNLVFTTDKNQYFLNELINVDGVVRDDEGNPVENANISYELDGSKGTTFTKKDGIFSFSLISPNKEGEFTLALEVSKINYLSASGSKKISVIAKKDLAIVFGIEQTIEAGKNQTINVRIVNSGQVDLHNLRVEIAGLPLDWFEFLPRRKEILAPGEEMNVKIEIRAPLELEPKTYRVSVNAKSDEVEKSDSFVLILQPPLIEEKVEKTKPTFSIGFFSLVLEKVEKIKWWLVALFAIVFLVAILKLKIGKREEMERIIGRKFSKSRIGRL